jgi:hypothetical protein
MDVSDQRVPLGQALDDSEITRRHKRFWLLAGLGILLDGFDFFIIGVVNPLLEEQYNLDSITLGLVSCAAIVGAIFGAGFLGPLAGRSVQSSSGRNTAGGSDRTNHPFSDFGRSRGKHFDRPNKHRLASHVGFWSDSCFGDYFCTAKNS